MKNLLFLLIFLVAFGCASTKELDSANAKNTQLSQQLTSTQSLLETSQKEHQALSVIYSTLMESNKECMDQLNMIKSSHERFRSKILNMKAELEAAFPNNLNEANFSHQLADWTTMKHAPKTEELRLLLGLKSQNC